MVGKILLPEIRTLIDARDFGALREIFREWPPADVAEVILDMPEDEQVIIFRVLPNALAADVFEYLDTEAQQQLLRAMAHEQVVGILNEMSPDDRTALLEEMPSAAARQLIKLLTPEERRVAQSLLGYPEGSIGRLMTPDFIAVHDDWTVKEVLDHVREFGRDSETLNVIYVVDERGKLIDDLLDVAEEEATEDIQKLGGMEALDKPYTTIPLVRMVKKRATWLIILFLGGILTATARQGYTSEIAKAAILAMFLP